MATNNMKSNLWTEEEINLLKNLNSKNMSIRDMADFFDNKTLKQVDYKYKYLFTQNNVKILIKIVSGWMKKYKS